MLSLPPKGNRAKTECRSEIRPPRPREPNRAAGGARQCLGTIASYSAARDVRRVRMVFCDAAAYDQGSVPAEEIADRVKVRGRGGTVLQPGIDLVEKAHDFPETGPILVITDGWCNRLHIRREHAFLLPEGPSLPFVAKGKVFGVK